MYFCDGGVCGNLMDVVRLKKCYGVVFNSNFDLNYFCDNKVTIRQMCDHAVLCIQNVDSKCVCNDVF